MSPLQHAALETFLNRYRTQTEFTAILLAGSLAHGFATDDSDIDIILVATEETFQKRSAARTLAFSLWDICNYEGGYIDCKIVSKKSLQQIAKNGSDAARYAFKDAQILLSRMDGLQPLLQEICRFPSERQADRQHRFACQLLAWKWYLSQAEAKQNAYLQHLACQKFTLFACRLVLNHNRLLYPYHKWMLAEAKRAALQPESLQASLSDFLDTPSFDRAQSIADTLLAFLGLDEKRIDWPNQFMTDSEQNWLHHEPPVDDL